jgi:hypothetical protein
MGNVDLLSDIPTNTTTDAKGSNSAHVKPKGHKKLRMWLLLIGVHGHHLLFQKERIL